MKTNEMVKAYMNMSEDGKRKFENAIHEEKMKAAKKATEETGEKLKNAKAQNKVMLKNMQEETISMLKHSKTYLDEFIAMADFASQYDAHPDVLHNGDMLSLNCRGVDAYFVNGDFMVEYTKDGNFLIEDDDGECTSILNQHKVVKDMLEFIEAYYDEIIEAISKETNEIISNTENRDGKAKTARYCF